MKKSLACLVIAYAVFTGMVRAERNKDLAPASLMLDTYVMSMCSSLAAGLHLSLNYERVEEVAGRAAQLLHPVTLNDEDKAGKAAAFQLIDNEDAKEIDMAVDECAEEGYIISRHNKS